MVKSIIVTSAPLAPNWLQGSCLSIKIIYNDLNEPKVNTDGVGW